MYAFELERPTTLADAIKALGGEEAQPSPVVRPSSRR